MLDNKLEEKPKRILQDNLRDLSYTPKQPKFKILTLL